MAVAGILYGPPALPIAAVAETKGPLTAAALSQTFSGLNGDVDKVYEIRGKIINDNGASAALYSIQFNGSATGITYRRAFGNGAAAGSDDPAYFALANSAGGLCEFTVRMNARTGELRLATVVGASMVPTGTQHLVFPGEIVWNDSSTNITSISIVSSQASGIGVNSEITLYKVRV